ncbi:PREDICTED: neuropeptide S receptor isoform X2 [Nanorana parkeri]|uniref:neuropeptide S receptor isoform X2 n=1 Tax=Nanorana parkeri TaxID=125878 RepID=UPI0008549796|nr:PREDICTED: neuropeptide S receptor isoform X2 [Nanorana parkeri]
MQVSFTEASTDSNRSTERLDLIIATCTSTISATDVAEENEWPSFYTSFKTEQLITLWILFVIIIIGNSVVLYLTWKERVRKRKSRMTFFVIQLAITEKQAKILITAAWTLSFLFSIPTLIIFGKIQLPNGETQCWALWPDDSYWKPYMTTVALLVYFIPLIIISVIYFIVIRTIWAKSKSHSGVIISNCTDGNFCASYNHRGLISKAKLKAIKYSIVVILAFVLCWSPYFLFDILDNFEMLPKTQERIYASIIIQNLPVLNSAVNPIIYCIFSNRHCRLSRDRNSGNFQGTLRDKTEGVEMQIVSKPEYI